MNPLDLTWVWALWVSTALLLQLIVCKMALFWKTRKIVGGLVVAMYLVSFPLLAVSHLQPWFGVGVAIATLYLLVNVLRLWADRFHAQFLQRSVVDTALWLSGFIVLLVVAAELVRLQQWHVAAYYVVGVLVSMSVALAWFLAWRARRGATEYQPVQSTEKRLRMKDLPTVSLVIPARNETHALEEMLTLAIKSDYPKLEILVLDDCSHDATASVIRSFAHDGVRFVQGTVPSQGWQGKNYASQVLAEEAAGDLLVYAAVDTHFDQQTISRMVSYMHHNKLQMLSVLPFRREFDVWPAFFEHLRNFMQVVIPFSVRWLPISSPCWAIWADDLRRMGGFAAYKSSVFPEAHFAKALYAKHTYGFVVANEQLVVTTRKRYASQLETATRTMYPFLKRRPFMVFAMGLILGALMLAPYGVVLWQLAHGSIGVLGILSLIAIIGFTLAHITVLKRTMPRSWYIGLVNFPIVVIQEILLYNWSMLQFEFGEVNWKGRNVCYPLVQALPMEDFTQQLRRPRS